MSALLPPPAPPPLPRTLAALRESGHVHRPVAAEVRENLLRRMGSGEPRFPGVHGFDATVLPRMERALLAGHDIVLLGERGQGKTRLIRTLTALLDEWSPSVAGCPVNDHPYAPVCPACVRRSAREGDGLPVVWRHRGERYGEKLATPDTGVGELVGDVDPARLAEGRSLGDPETIHYGLVPRANRGVFCVNELPDLPARAQVALFNVLEERDLQVRGYSLRLPLDLLLVASANPEDYTSRGRIVTPLKDRFGAQVRTHYPPALADELALIRQEAALPEGTVVPAHLLEAVARFTRLVRASRKVDARSGVSVRFSVTAAETVAASALRRAALSGEELPVARVCDLPAAVEPLLGKVEFEMDAEGREAEILHALLRRAVAEVFRERLGEADLSPLSDRFSGGGTVETGDLVGAAELLRRVGAVPGLATMIERAAPDAEDGPPTPGLAAAVVEFALEGLYLERRLSKDTLPDGGVYRF
ncbi:MULTISPECIES: sigma 54-interacting transcriptional regulator [Nocardiopsis]|uniref:Magnesium chelatase n=1 Tax=Nocardiopsis sinuspersici TaxID=501010 RepID=A0A1V3C8L4_9ACTN|nr:MULTISPECIES: sigma 54-interacting transcriptional regulator [Nocardiopsis]NYH53540.1 magnesium chelatase subunit I [Nocardiopsis sinuspersici]OOC56856.1 magnesium chelatase [Nocardiopsis sinuspersici]